MARLFDGIAKICLLLGCVVTTVWATISPVQATVIPYHTLEQAIVQASVIVRGRLLNKTYLWGPEQRHIYTDLQLQVLETLKGDTTPTLVIRQLGGMMGERVSMIPGSATFQQGEEVVLFLEPQRPGKYYFVMGLAAGKYQVIRQGSLALLYRNVHDISFHRPLGSSTQLPTIYHLNYSEAPLSLAQLRVLIQRTQKARSQSPHVPGHVAPAQPNGGLSLPTSSVDPQQQKRARMLIFLQRWKSLQHPANTKMRPQLPGTPILRTIEPSAPSARVPGTLLVKPERVPSRRRIRQEGGQR